MLSLTNISIFAGKCKRDDEDDDHHHCSQSNGEASGYPSVLRNNMAGNTTPIVNNNGVHQTSTLAAPSKRQAGEGDSWRMCLQYDMPLNHNMPLNHTQPQVMERNGCHSTTSRLG
ncbi:hypothetical protein ACOMHN_039108 [Nucella lapillus]